MDAAVVAEIQRRLSGIEHTEAVRIPLAVESGSRAWGFASPDSDYDCRFVYVRRHAQIASLFPPRDVIETPLTPVFDVNGWELAKALRLMLKGNAVILEWLRSPVDYRVDEGFRAALLDFSEMVFQRGVIGWHYFSQLRSTFQRDAGDPAQVSIKRVFYLLRPAMALRYMRMNAGSAMVPMNFDVLCAGAELRPGDAALLQELLAQKRMSREIARVTVPARAIEFVREEEEAALGWVERPVNQPLQWRPDAERLYQRLLDKFAPPAAA